MTMKRIKLKRILEDEFKQQDYRTSYNRDEDVFRVEWKETREGVSVKLPSVIAKYNERGQVALDDLVAHLKQGLAMMNLDYDLTNNEANIYPVIRSTSFPIETKAGKKLVYKEHTAETRIFYALDIGKSYRLIDESMLSDTWTRERVSEIALFNNRSLSTNLKKDQVRGNSFYFLATQDGYDASRILNEKFLNEQLEKTVGEMTVSVPHQDVLIIGDIQNDVGYDILAQMTMKFFAEGRIPITSLSFVYDEKGLEPIFILAKNKAKTDDKE